MPNTDAPQLERDARMGASDMGPTDGVRGPYFARRMPWLAIPAHAYREARSIVLVDPATRPGMWMRIAAHPGINEGPEAGARLRPLWDFGVVLTLYPRSLTLSVQAPAARARAVGWDGAEIETLSVRRDVVQVLHEAVATQRAALKAIAKGHAFRINADV
jgi:hypothetical protein